ncbi:MAG: DUF2868 domain-containing protein [Oceanicoccus sp.]
MSINNHLLSFIQCEYLRLQEQSGEARVGSNEAEAQLLQQQLSPEQAIAQRATLLLSTAEKNKLLAPAKHYRQLSIALLSFFSILGGFATVEVFSGVERASANFFWILLGLLGVNALSMFIWLVLIVWPNTDNQSGSWLMSLQVWLSRKRSQDNNALQAWQQAISNTGGQQWHLAVISHGLWLAFLSGTLIMAWLLLSTRQFDFVWETTILDGNTFVHISQWLTTLPSLLGIELPTAKHVIASRIGESPQDPDELRLLWSNLLLSSLALYGLLPRAIALLYAIFVRRHHWNKAAPDFSTPYYYQLKMRLSPDTIAEGVVDNDRDSRVPTNDFSASNTATIAKLEQLEGVCLAGLECDGKWPPLLSELGLDYLSPTVLSVNAIDRSTREQLLTEASNHNVHNILLLARFEATPDRGIVRFIRQLNDKPASLWLLLVEHRTQQTSQQWHDWLSAACDAQLQPQQIARLSREMDNCEK